MAVAPFRPGGVVAVGGAGLALANPLVRQAVGAGVRRVERFIRGQFERQEEKEPMAERRRKRQRFEQPANARAVGRAVRKQLARNFRRELKHHTINSANVTLVNADIWTPISGATSDVCLVAQGNGPGERIGHRIYVKSLQVKVNVSLTTNATSIAADLAPRYKIMVVLNKQANGAISVGNEVYDWGAFGQKAYRNLNYTEKYKVLKFWDMIIDGTKNVNPPAPGDTVTRHIIDHRLVFKNPIKIEFSGATGAIAERVGQNIEVWAVRSTTQTGVGRSIMSINCSSRIRYND